MISSWQVLLSALFVLLTWMFNKVKTIYNRLNKKNTKVPDVDVLNKIFPLSKEAGWKVSAVKNGVPIWKYQTTFTFAPNNLYGCRALLQGKPETILNELLNVKTFCSLFPNFSPLKLEKKGRNKPFVNSEVLSVSNINTSLSLTSIITSHHSIFTLERCWFKDNNSAWLYMCPTSSLLSNQYGYWITFFVHELNYDNACLLHVLASYPASTEFSYISQMLSSCLVLARENMDFMQLLKLRKQMDANIRDSVSPPRSTAKQSQQLQTSQQPKTKSPKTPRNKFDEAVGLVEVPAEINHIQTPTTEKEKTIYSEKNDVPKKEDNQNKKEIQKIEKKSSEPKSKFSYDEELLPYVSLLEESYNKLYNIFKADATTPGWYEMGIKEGIQLFRKDGDEESGSGTYKGVSTINVPLPYLLAYTHNLDYRTEFDAIYESGSEFKVFKDEVTKINHLLYQNVWPTTGRDFCSIAAVRHLEKNIYGSAVRAVVHPECPDRKNKVRGEILIGGYVFEELSKDPPAVRMTYITRVDLKGSIPQRIINRVNAEQPLIAGIIKKHVERRYEIQDPDTDGMEILNKIRAVPSVFEDPPPIESETIVERDVETNTDNTTDEVTGDTCGEVTKENIMLHDVHGTRTPVHNANDTSTPVLNVSTSEDNTDENFVLGNGFNLRDQQYGKSADDESGLRLPRRMTSEDSLMSDSVSVSGLSQFTDDQTQISICEQPLDLPRDASGKIDYITLGNQAAAALEEEFIVARSVTAASSVNEDVSDNLGNWTYQSNIKDVEILRKISPGQKFHSFLGRGIINALPVTVWEAIKNPTTRFIYDNMLKKNVTVKEISDRHRILHMRHETTACFVKQARDFCLLTVERVEQQRYTLVGTSVEIPECPPVRDCVRGRILSSGWVIEPILHGGRYCSKVTYIIQVDFGGRLPTRVTNFIAKRQPLALAYLRDYLESSEF